MRAECSLLQCRVWLSPLNMILFILKNTTYEEEKHVCMLVIATINDIQAHHSPVLIIQRFIRGFLTRKRLVSVHISFQIVFVFSCQPLYSGLQVYKCIYINKVR